MQILITTTRAINSAKVLTKILWIKRSGHLPSHHQSKEALKCGLMICVMLLCLDILKLSKHELLQISLEASLGWLLWSDGRIVAFKRFWLWFAVNWLDSIIDNVEEVQWTTNYFYQDIHNSLASVILNTKTVLKKIETYITSKYNNQEENIISRVQPITSSSTRKWIRKFLKQQHKSVKLKSWM